MQSAYKTRHFSRWAGNVGLSDAALAQAVTEMEAGLIDANLGGGLVKKRVPLPGRGKRGGVRTIVATSQAGRWFFVLGFEKNVMDNIPSKELRALQDLAADLLALDEKRLALNVEVGKLQEIAHEKPKHQ